MKKIITFIVLMVSMFAMNSNSETYYYDYDQSDLLAYESYYDDFPYELIYQNLTVSDLYGLNCYELRILRNTIFAYRGYKFKSNDLKTFFGRLSWYRGSESDQSKVMKRMTKTEKHNIEVIKKRERQLGC